MTPELKEKHGKPMRIEAWIFAAGALVFVPLAGIYGWLAGWEPVGTVGLLLLGFLAGLIGAYLWVVGNRVDMRPSDNPAGEIEESAGELGVFSPWSWWPLVLGLATAVAFLGLAIGWWLLGIGVVLALIGLVGLLFEFSRGYHAH
jgi:hypothetical protein